MEAFSAESVALAEGEPLDRVHGLAVPLLQLGLGRRGSGDGRHGQVGDGCLKLLVHEGELGQDQAGQLGEHEHETGRGMLGVRGRSA